jgi:hypothetical protein
MPQRRQQLDPKRRRGDAPPKREDTESNRDAPPAAVLRLQRTAGNVAVRAMLQRDDTTTKTPAPPAPQPSTDTSVDFGWFTAHTFADVANGGRLLVGQLESDIKDLGWFAARERAEEWMAWIQFWEPYLDKQGSAPLTPEAATKARDYIKDYVSIREAIIAESDSRVRDELRRARQQAEDAAAEAQKMKPKLDDALRDAFRTGEESMIEKAADVSGTALDIGLGFNELSRKISEEIGKSHEFGELAPMSKFTEALNGLNKGLAVINLAFALTGEKKTTELEEGARWIGVATTAFASLVTLAALPAHMALYADLYLVPMTKAIIAQLGHITDLLHEENKDWVEFSGEPMYPGAEPGGEEMFKFMVNVMHAAGPEGVPSLPKEVQSFLFEHREALEAGAKEEVPTTGWWFWRDIDTKKAVEWVYYHRDRIWAMFYGSMKVPEKKKK